MTMRASERGWTAAKVFALTSVIVASCALPGYEIGNTTNSGSASSGGGASGTTSVNGAGGAGGSVEASGAGGLDDNDGGTKPDASDANCPNPDKEPTPGESCSLMDGTMCSFHRPCCTIFGKCKGGQWLLPPAGCPGGCPDYPPPATCDCTNMNIGPNCFYDTGCGSGGEVKHIFCESGQMTIEPFPCCGPDGACSSTEEVCVHIQTPNDTFHACKVNPCGEPIDCQCVDAKGVCGPDNITCDKTDPTTGVYCSAK